MITAIPPIVNKMIPYVLIAVKIDNHTLIFSFVDNNFWKLYIVYAKLHNDNL